MKHTKLLSAVALAGLLLAPADAFCRQRPYHIGTMDKPTSENHPWGGENNITPLRSGRVPKIELVNKSGYLLTDIINGFLLERLISRYSIPVNNSQPVQRNSNVSTTSINQNGTNQQDTSNRGM